METDRAEAVLCFRRRRMDRWGIVGGSAFIIIIIIIIIIIAVGLITLLIISMLGISQTLGGI